MVSFLRLFKNKKSFAAQKTIKSMCGQLPLCVCAFLCALISLSSHADQTKQNTAHQNAVRVELATVSIKNQTSSQSQIWLAVSFNLTGIYPLKEALDKGLDQFTFIYEFEWRQARWYWFDKIKSRKKIVLSVSASPFDKKYRLEQGGQIEFLSDFQALVRSLSTPPEFAFIDSSELLQGSEYELWIRFRLDDASLPRLIQIDRINNNEWRVDTGWFKKHIEISSPIVEKSGA